MKHLEYVYFNIYLYCHERNNSLSNFSARLQAMYIVALSAGGWVLLAQTLYLRIVRRAWFASQSSAMSFAVLVYVFAALVFYRIFIVNNYDEKIYNKYEPSRISQPNKRNGLLLSLLVASIPYLLMFSMRMFFPGQHYR